jgi:hypothetical protein
MQTIRGSRRIEDVIDDLTIVIEKAHAAGSRRGYFAALYRATTGEVLRAVEAGRFQDPERLVRMDVIFGGLYLRAVRETEAGRPCAGPWAVAFEAENNASVAILQHLLLGMNAHINLDLPVATLAASGRDLPAIRHDYDLLNGILARMIDRMQAGLNQVSPALARLDRLGGPIDELLAAAGIHRFRDAAWEKAEQLRDQAGYEAELEAEVQTTAERLVMARHLLGWARDEEPDQVAEDQAGVRAVIEALAAAIPAPDVDDPPATP